MIEIPSLYIFFKNHPHFISKMLFDLIHIWWWKICQQPIVVLTTESGGLGDYLWIRNYYRVIREHYAPKKCRIIVVGMRQWEPLAMEWDAGQMSNHFNVYRSFESPDHPLKIEALFFNFFKADVYVDFRARHLQNLVKAQKYFWGEGFCKSKKYYETVNNDVIGKWFTLPDDFSHTPPLLPIADKSRRAALEKPYVVVVEGGNTQGKLSNEQTQAIVESILKHGYNIFFNGDYLNLFKNHTSLFEDYSSQIIDGYTFPLREYATIVRESVFVITVNTFVYHLAVQLEKFCIVLSANEYESVKLDFRNQIVIFNKELQKAFETKTLNTYKSIATIGLQDIECDRIKKEIEAIIKIINP